MQIKYKKGYKYQLYETYSIKIDIIPKYWYCEDFLELDLEGNLTIYKGYCWDGASGGAIDNKTFMRASLIHDALYQLLRAEVIDKKNKEKADALMTEICEKDGMNWFRRKYTHLAVKLFGFSSINPKNERKILVSP